MTAPANTQETAPRPFGPHPGLEPRRNPAARWITILVGVLFLALSGVIARELWFRYQDETFSSWLSPVYDFLATHVVDAAAVTVGIILALVGLWLIVTAFLPRAHTHMQIDSPASIWVRPVDVARKSTHATRAEVGSENIRSKADRKRLTVEVEDDGSGYVEERVRSTLGRELQRLANPPAVTVKVLPRAGAQSGAAQPTAAQPTGAAKAQPAATYQAGPAQTTQTAEYEYAPDLAQVEEELR